MGGAHNTRQSCIWGQGLFCYRCFPLGCGTSEELCLLNCFSAWGHDVVQKIVGCLLINVMCVHDKYIGVQVSTWFFFGFLVYENSNMSFKKKSTWSSKTCRHILEVCIYLTFSSETVKRNNQKCELWTDILMDQKYAYCEKFNFKLRRLFLWKFLLFIVECFGLSE